MRQITKSQIKKGAEEVSEALTKFFSIGLSGSAKKISMITFLFLFNVCVTTPGSMNNSLGSVVPKMSAEQIYVESVKSKMKESLVMEVKTYLETVAPDTKLTPELIVDMCVKYETDIVFVLAQGLLESHFGTKGKAKTTNSVWNVGTYDDGRILYTYETPDESLEPYLRLINEKYLINITSKGDTIYKDISHLTSDKGYVNEEGKRFASARGYEDAMRKLMITIDTKTSIKFYQEIVMMPSETILAYFNPEKSTLAADEFIAMN